MTLPIGHNTAALSTAAAPPQFPVLIAEWDRNSRETIRVVLDEFQGRAIIALRVWYRPGDGGHLRPGKAGMTVAVKHLPAMAEALARALARAIDLGLVSEGGEQ